MSLDKAELGLGLFGVLSTSRQHRIWGGGLEEVLLGLRGGVGGSPHPDLLLALPAHQEWPPGGDTATRSASALVRAPGWFRLGRFVGVLPRTAVPDGSS